MKGRKHRCRCAVAALLRGQDALEEQAGRKHRCRWAVAAVAVLLLAACATMPPETDLRAQRIEQAVVPMARAALAAGQVETARRLYTRLLEVAPEAVDARMGLGDVALAVGEPANAATWYLDAAGIAQNPAARHAALLAHGRASITAGNLDAARTSFERLVNAEEGALPITAAWGHNGLAVVAILEGDPAGAVTAVERALLLAPDERRFRENLARAAAIAAAYDATFEAPLVEREPPQFKQTSKDSNAAREAPRSVQASAETGPAREGGRFTQVSTDSSPANEAPRLVQGSTDRTGPQPVHANRESGPASEGGRLLANVAPAAQDGSSSRATESMSVHTEQVQSRYTSAGTAPVADPTAPRSEASAESTKAARSADVPLESLNSTGRAVEATSANPAENAVVDNAPTPNAAIADVDSAPLSGETDAAASTDAVEPEHKPEWSARGALVLKLAQVDVDAPPSLVKSDDPTAVLPDAQGTSPRQVSLGEGDVAQIDEGTAAQRCAGTSPCPQAPTPQPSVDVASTQGCSTLQAGSPAVVGFAATGADGEYWQVGAFAVEANAHRLAERVAPFTNLPVGVQPPFVNDRTPLHRVRIGPLPSPAALSKLKAVLHGGATTAAQSSACATDSGRQAVAEPKTGTARNRGEQRRADPPSQIAQSFLPD